MLVEVQFLPLNKMLRCPNEAMLTSESLKTGKMRGKEFYGKCQALIRKYMIQGSARGIIEDTHECLPYKHE